MLYNVTLYYNTGFDAGNIPDSPARLDAYTSRVFQPINIRQDYGQAYVRIKATWADVRDADYAKLEPEDGSASATYYVIPSPAVQVNDNVAHIPLLLDPLTSIGGIANLSVLAGWTHRAHAGNDDLFSNTIAEPWAPSQPLQIKNYKVIHTEKELDSNGDPKPNLRIAVGTCDLSRGHYAKAKIVHASEQVANGEDLEGDFMYMTLPMPADNATQPIVGGVETELQVGAYRGPGTSEETYTYTLPNLYCFNLDNSQVIAGINGVRSIGVESAIIAMYCLPVEDAGAIEIAHYPHNDGDAETSGLIIKLYGKSNTYKPGTPYLYYDFKNKKAASLFNYFQVTSITSGDSNAFSAADLYVDGETGPTFVTQTDPSPNGTVYCSPTHYEGQPTHRLEQAVAGLPWLNAGFTYTHASGSALALANAKRANAKIEMDRDFNIQGLEQNRNQARWKGGLAIAQDVVGGVSDLIQYAGDSLLGMSFIPGQKNSAEAPIGSLLDRGFNIANNAVDLVYNEKHTNRNIAQANANAQYQMGDNLFSAAVNANVTAPSLAFPISVNASAYYGNGFAILQITLRDNDAKRLDDFLSAYGYAQDKSFEKSDLTNRTKHNYIKTSGAEVDCPGAPRWLLGLIGQMFDAGVRIWHSKPSRDNLLNNPIGG